MNSEPKAARILGILGCVVLFAAAALHCFAATKVFPIITASNLAAALQGALKVLFLAVAWHWAVIAMVALVATLNEMRVRKMLVLLCGIAILIEAAAGAAVMGLFIGNEMIGTAAILIVIGGLLFKPAQA